MTGLPRLHRHERPITVIGHHNRRRVAAFPKRTLIECAAFWEANLCEKKKLLITLPKIPMKPFDSVSVVCN